MDTLCRLMSPDLPLRIEPKRLARIGETIAGEYAIHDMQRLVELLYDSTGKVIFSLDFIFDNGQNIPLIKGSIEAQVNIPCQRCLGGMEFKIDNPVFLGITNSRSGSVSLPDECEPLQLDEDSILLQDLIEDELILALPISAMHNAHECNATELIDKIKDNNRSSPFAALDKLNRK